MIGQAGTNVQRDGKWFSHDAAHVLQSETPNVPVRDGLNRRDALFISHRTEQVRKSLLQFQIFLDRLPAPDAVRSVTSPNSASNSGNSPLSTAIRATLMVSCGSDPQPSGQGTWMWM